MSFAFGTLQDGHTLGVGGGTAMPAWKMRCGDLSVMNYGKAFCYVRQDLDFSGFRM